MPGWIKLAQNVKGSRQSLIHTCKLNGTNPFDCLTELQKHGEELAKHPAWNYARSFRRPSERQSRLGTVG